MCVITHTHASTCATSLVCKKLQLPLLFMTLIAQDIGMMKMKEQKQQIGELIIFL